MKVNRRRSGVRKGLHRRPTDRPNVRPESQRGTLPRPSLWMNDGVSLFVLIGFDGYDLNDQLIDDHGSDKRATSDAVWVDAIGVGPDSDEPQALSGISRKPNRRVRRRV